MRHRGPIHHYAQRHLYDDQATKSDISFIMSGKNFGPSPHVRQARHQVSLLFLATPNRRTSCFRFHDGSTARRPHHSYDIQLPMLGSKVSVTGASALPFASR